MEVRDSRRLTGPNVLWDAAGAVLDVALESHEAEAAVAAWRPHARAALDAVGWHRERLCHRIFPGGVSLALSAPMDALYAATEVNELAWQAAAAELADEEPPALDEAAGRLRALIEEESNPRLLALRREAARRGLTALSDDDRLSVGLGTGSTTWAVDALPRLDTVDWSRLHDIPVALVTGTNGKTTTVRLLTAMVAAAGRTAGSSSTDWIRVADDVVESGDYSGPGGARTVLRDPRVEIAILETARGGMLRRGLAVQRADVALITNVAEDHLGEFGIFDLGMLADTKFVVRQAAERLVLNADDPIVRERGLQLSQPITWFTREPHSPATEECRRRAAAMCFVEDGRLVWQDEAGRSPVAAVADVPIALGGAARHNVSNALGAIGVAAQLGLPIAAMRRGLTGFHSTPDENPGRLNEFELGGVRVIVDFAHNPHGVEALLEMAAALPGERRLIQIGQAGDRDDESIRALARSVWAARPDRVIVKKMAEYSRGRPDGEVADLIEGELRRLGAGPEAIDRADTELEAARRAFEWARPGDLLLLIVHSHRDEVLGLIEEQRVAGWRPR